MSSNHDHIAHNHPLHHPLKHRCLFPLWSFPTLEEFPTRPLYIKCFSLFMSSLSCAKKFNGESKLSISTQLPRKKKNTNYVSTNTLAFYHKCSFIQSCQNLLFNEGWEHLKLDDPWLLGQRFLFYNKWLQINVWGSTQYYGGSSRWIVDSLMLWAGETNIYRYSIILLCSLSKWTSERFTIWQWDYLLLNHINYHRMIGDLSFRLIVT